MAALQNLSFGFRTLRKSKSFTITAVLTLAWGIGATTANNVATLVGVSVDVIVVALIG